MPDDTSGALSTPLLLTVEQTRRQLGCSRRHVYNLINRGELTSVRTRGPRGNPWGHRIEQAEIHAYIERNRQTAQAPAAS